MLNVVLLMPLLSKLLMPKRLLMLLLLLTLKRRLGNRKLVLRLMANLIGQVNLDLARRRRLLDVTTILEMSLETFGPISF